jgi:hypothetical protein
MTHETRYLSAMADTGRRQSSPWRALVASAVMLVFALQSVAQAPVAPTVAAAVPSSDALETLVGPIALYPDDLIAVILPASTNPLQLVQADRYLEKRKADPKLPIDDKWDDAVKTLLNYPEVVKTMSGDLDWTSALGEAVVADTGAVLEAVQTFRRKAQAAGNLKSDTKQVVKTEKEIIIIQPADPQVIYVPQYNPTTIITYGVTPVYGYYPAPYPSYYYPYPPGAALATGLIWGAAIGAAWNGGHYNYGYGGGSYYGGKNDINIDRSVNINYSGNNNISGNRAGNANTLPARGTNNTQWKSNKQPGQVSSSVGKTAPSARVGDARAGAGGAASTRPSTQPSRAGSAGGTAGAGARPSTQPAAAGGLGSSAGAGARPSTQPAGAGGLGSSAGGARPSTQPVGAGADRAGGSRGGDAFSGYGSGRQAQMDSSRGAASRGSMSGGGARSGGGGGGRSGGGRR